MPRPDTLTQRLRQAAQQPPEPPMVLERPAYAADFAEWLAYRFAQVAVPQVPAVLRTHFPTPDQVDCTYLREVLHAIEQARYCERGVGCGTTFVYWGIEFSAPHMAGARQWLADAEAGLG